LDSSRSGADEMQSSISESNDSLNNSRERRIR